MRHRVETKRLFFQCLRKSAYPLHKCMFFFQFAYTRVLTLFAFTCKIEKRLPLYDEKQGITLIFPALVLNNAANLSGIVQQSIAKRITYLENVCNIRIFLHENFRENAKTIFANMQNINFFVSTLIAYNEKICRVWTNIKKNRQFTNDYIVYCFLFVNYSCAVRPDSTDNTVCTLLITNGRTI
jgi:hypothetical protein